MLLLYDFLMFIRTKGTFFVHYSFNRNQIITVTQIIQPGAFVLWQIINDIEYDELISRRLWREVEKQNLV